MALKKPKRAGKKKKKNERRNLQSKHRTKAFFIPHVSGMCLTSNISELCNSFFKALPLTVCTTEQCKAYAAFTAVLSYAESSNAVKYLLKMTQKKYDYRYDELVSVIEASKEMSLKTDKFCKCFLCSTETICVGIQTDTNGDESPLYINVKTCIDCGAKRIS